MDEIDLPRGAVHELSGLAIVIGDVPRDPSVETVIRAQPRHPAAYTSPFPTALMPNADPLLTGDIEFAVSAP